ncbi:M23 family metallopeptidase [Ferdinandcohnia quinoae]|uniref:M23 family metallopeptidase n=1 Tax=Fredinandcohnia quinoae TaxID=2918902 RepID=A0AAW5DY02_9BACI|nr:M23 family metallopeptidase [Fredinandcohnia sp. SECRCQ15]MCH1625547.1 M23 family metallopeptidase [Fredinandcohnia sp. SECRCQ15]
MNRLVVFGLIALLFFANVPESSASETDQQKIYQERIDLFSKMEAITQIPWYYFAAIDQYERSVRRVRKDIPKETGLIGIYIKPEIWSGAINPDLSDTNPLSIQIFGGIGVDGNGDGIADQTNDEDVLYTIANHLLDYGFDRDNIKLALWDYYKRDKSVSLIMGKVKMYETYGTLDLDKHAFPVPLRYNYSYKNTWGSARGWGGRRMHEGTDIFAGYGTPVRATSYGIVEMKGWNRFGGWRIGIRDINNTYHYFAHLNGFADGIKVGRVVEPGMIIGSVGSSGYGPPGTSGKFPPHLHYGMYKDNGKTEWSFDPFPHLKSWERGERQRRK